MADATLLEYFQELVEEYDETISTGSGASFRTKIIDPILARIGDSALDTNLETFLATRVKEEITDLDTGENSGIRDLVIRPMAIMLAPLRREINAIKLGQSLNNYEEMTRAELNSLLGNFFLTLQDGEKASGTARVYYTTPQTSVVSTLTKFMTEKGLIFHASSVTSVTAVDMAFSQEGEYYYLDVDVVAAETGSDYNIAAGDIITIEGIVGPVSVTNKKAFTSAVDDETKGEAVGRAQESITIRHLATSRGIKTLVASEYPDIDVIEVVGFGDIDMVRDVVTGPANVSGVPGGFTGEKDPDLDSTSIHIGGKTDVYIFQETPVASSMDMTNITDVGKQIMRSESGYTSAAGLGKLYDNRGYFESYGVTAGDYLRLGRIEVILSSVTSETEISLGSYIDPDDDSSTLSALPEGLFNQFYEIVRYHPVGKIRVPLTDLVALDSTNAPVTNDSGDYIQPVPGDNDLSALLDSDDEYVAKTENVSANNLSLPVVRPVVLGFLNPTSLESTGEYLPLGEALFTKAVSDFTSGSGLVRTYFQDAISCCLSSTGAYEPAAPSSGDGAGYPTFTGQFPIFAYEGFSYTTTPVVVGRATGGTAGNGYLNVSAAQYAADSGGTDTIDLVYDETIASLTAAQKVSAGDFIVGVERSNGTHTGSITIDDQENGPIMIESVTPKDTSTVVLTLRHDGPHTDSSGTSRTYALTVGGAGTIYGFNIVRGVSYDEMEQDVDTGLYYFQYIVTQDSSETENNLSVGDITAIGHPSSVGVGGDPLGNDMWSEGYRMRSDEGGVAFSNREKPYLEMTPYVLGSNLNLASTAYALRFSYDYADLLDTVQDFVEDEDNRIVAEDILVKHFLPGMVQGSITATGVAAAAGLAVLQEVISKISPTTNLEVSDLVGALYEAEATHVALPISLVVVHHSQNRVISATLIEDSETAHRIQKFIPDPDYFTYSEES